MMKVPFILSILLFFLTHVSSGQVISNYRSFPGWGILKKDAGEVIILREFEREKHSWYFTVSPNSINTAVVRSDSIRVIPASWESLYAKFSGTAYILALQQVEANSSALQDAGLRSFKPSQKGIDLTIDLCPSHRPLDRIVFSDLIREMAKVEKPVPLSVSITGQWINKHPKDLNWLDSLDRKGDLDIVWINHTYNHYTAKNVPLDRNFMLAPGTNLKEEVMNVEIALIEKDMLPSVFFRFPGLVSDREIFNRVVNLGLIPVGSDAWLAKGQWPKDGSIVLIHANGNEPLGVHDFITLLSKKKEEVLSRRWELFDLRESLVDDESKKP